MKSLALRSTLVGALWFFICYAAGLTAYSGFEVMGEVDDALKNFVDSHYFWFTLALQAALGAVALLLGGSVGYLAGLTAGRLNRGIGTAVGIVLFVWLAVEYRQVVFHPQFLDGPYLAARPWLAAIVLWPTRSPAVHAVIADIALVAVAPLLLYAPARRMVETRLGGWIGLSLLGIYLFGYAAERLGMIPVFYGAAQGERPNVVLLVVDSLRPDHLSVNGYARDTTPTVDAVARAGTLYNRVVVDVPRTFPSWVTMMTGRYALDHGVRHMFPTAEQRETVYPPLPKVLGEAGYQTAVVSDFAGDIFPRIDFGFQQVIAPDLTFDAIVAMRNLEIHPLLMAFLNNRLGKALFPAIRELVYNGDPTALVDDGLRTLRRFDRSRPFMLALFFSTSHLPYAPPGPYYARYADPAYDGVNRFQRKNMLMKEGEAPEEVAQFVALYDGGLRAIDDQIARLLVDLDRLGYADNTVVAITGDHGEAFYEHGADIGHGNHLRGPYAQTVPLAIYDPSVDRAPTVVDKQVRSIDLAPTLAAAVGVPFPTAAGEALTDVAVDRPAYAESGLWYLADGPFFYQKLRLRYPGVTRLCEVDDGYRNEVVIKNRYQGITAAAKHRMYADGRWKLIAMPTETGVVYELYDTAADPGETTNLVADRPEEAARLRRALAALIDASRIDAMVGDYPMSRWSAAP
jgi:arylsulfatase A-like enzyme